MGVIYSIVNKINDACYIGSTIGNGKSRWIRHKTDLNANKHHSNYLQRAWDKYGSNNFEFKILLSVEDDILLIKEQEYLDDRKNNYPAKLNYNVLWVAGNCTGRKYSESTLNKMSKSHLGKKIPLETREKLSISHANRINKTYRLISPNNEIFEFNNIRKFCRENKLEHNSIGQLLKGKIYYCNGWIKDYSHTYSFISPDGIVYENIVSLTNFCKEHNLKMKGMSKLHRNDAKSYLGWKKC